MPVSAFTELDDDVPRCRVCGCTEDTPCPGGCVWVPDPALAGDLCSKSLDEGFDGIVSEAVLDQVLLEAIDG